jgi:hypothetical protein
MLSRSGRPTTGKLHTQIMEETCICLILSLAQLKKLILMTFMALQLSGRSLETGH